MTKNSSITNKEYWDNYWTNYQYDDVPKKVVFAPFVPRLSKGKTFIEIGGFPGTFAAYFYQQGISDVTILDYHINEKAVREFERKNNIPEKSIRCIEHDFLTFSPDRSYDVVFSSGFIEHFEDIQDVIRRHVNILSEKGQLLMLIPNFLGLNGKLQRLFDKENIDAHNLQSMELAYLKEIMSTFGLRNVSIDYIGKPMVWLEPKPENHNKRKWVKMLSYAIKLFPIKGRFLSPFIAIYATK